MISISFKSCWRDRKRLWSRIGQIGKIEGAGASSRRGVFLNLLSFLGNFLLRAEERLREYVKARPFMKKYLKWADLQEETRYQYMG